MERRRTEADEAAQEADIQHVGLHVEISRMTEDDRHLPPRHVIADGDEPAG